MISSDDKQFGGHGRINNTVEHFTHPEGTPGERPPFCVFFLHARPPFAECSNAKNLQRMRVGSAGCAGVRETNFNDRAFSMKVCAPSRTVGIYARMPEPEEETAAS